MAGGWPTGAPGDRLPVATDAGWDDSGRRIDKVVHSPKSGTFERSSCANVAVPRILDLLDEVDVPATFFTPGHTIDSFPEAAGEVHDRGYDIQHHGWSHTNPSEFETKEDEKADIERAIESVQDLTGSTPTGYRSPAWDFSPNTLEILQDLDFEWDSSQMGHDFQPYYLRESTTVDPTEPYTPGAQTEILEIPVAWNRDDWPPFQYISGTDSQGGAPDEKQVFDM